MYYFKIIIQRLLNKSHYGPIVQCHTFSEDLPTRCIICFEHKLRSHPETSVWSGMRNNLHLRQPSIIVVDATGTAPMVTTATTGTTMMIIEASVITDSIPHGILEEPILHQPIIQRKRWLDITCISTFLALQSPLCLGFHFQLDRCVVANLLFGDG